MADWYVTKNGSDSNGGTSWADAKLTGQAAVTAAATNDNLHLGQGIYYEAVNATNKNINVYCYNRVVLDGNAALATAWTAGNGSLKVLLGTFRIQNYTTALSSNPTAVIYYEGFQVFHCTTGLYTATNNAHWYIKNVLIDDCTYGISWTQTIITAAVTNCTLVNCVNAVYATSASPGTAPFYSNVFAYNDYHIYYSNVGATGYLGDYNLLYFDGSAKCYLGGVEYSDLASWRTATGDDANSTSEDPLMTDPAKGGYRPQSGSPMLSGGRGEIDIAYEVYRGAYGRMAIAFSANTVGREFSGWLLTDLEVDGNGDLALSAGVTFGTADSQVYDAGEYRRLGTIAAQTSEAWANYPDRKVDYDNTSPEAGNMPNRAQMYFRRSGAPFLQGDALPAWSETDMDADDGAAGQYWQIRLKLVEDGVP